MSFLAGRSAGKEAAFFFEESKRAVNRLAEKIPAGATKNVPPVGSQPLSSPSDVLPEVLRHSLPSEIFRHRPDPSSLSAASKWALRGDQNEPSSRFSGALNPLRAYLSMPQVTFGPKRWEMPYVENSVLASTANELRKDRYTPVNQEKLKAAAEGLRHIGKAFMFATVIVFGSATLVFGFAFSKLEMHNGDDIKRKGQSLFQPRFETIREQLFPMRTWVENMTKKWHLERSGDVKEKPMIKELTKVLGARTSN